MDNRILSRPDLLMKNRFKSYGSECAPIDEAKAIPLMMVKVVNALPNGLCRTVLGRNKIFTQTVSDASDRFARFDHPGADGWHAELRFEMDNHLRELMGDAAFTETVPVPRTWLQASALKFLDWCFPEHRAAQGKAAHDLLLQTNSAKYALIRSAVMQAALENVTEATADEKQAS